MNNFFLEDFFLELEKSNVDYLVLRGYQNLPKNHGYDIDFSVRNEKELFLFFHVINKLSKSYNFYVTRDTVRKGLIKVFLHFESEILRVDVFYCFRYVGLEYINMNELHNSKRKLKSGISIPSLNYELSISLLKEILHNSRIREDKIDLLRTQYDKQTFKIPFLPFFSKKIIDQISNCLFSKKSLYFKKFSIICRINLLFSNFMILGLFKTIYNILEFFIIKYYYQKKYDKAINYLKLN